MPTVALRVMVYVLSTMNEYDGREKVLGSELVDVMEVLCPLSSTAHLYLTGIGGMQLDRDTVDRIVSACDDVIV